MRFREWLMLESDTNAFLRGIMAAAGDATPLLVYADWLDEHDEPELKQLAEFLRLAVRYCGLPGGPDRDAAAARLNVLLARYNLSGSLPGLYDQGNTKVLQKGRKTGDRFRIRLGKFERQAGNRGWTPHEGDLPDDAARQLIASLASRWARPTNLMARDGRNHFLDRQAQLLSTEAYNLYAQFRNGFHTPAWQLGMSQAEFFFGRWAWLHDAEEVVARVERLAAAGYQMETQEDLRILGSVRASFTALMTNEIGSEADRDRVRSLAFRLRNARLRLGYVEA